MPGHQPTAADPSRQDPFRWPHADILTALDDFADPDPPSQRQFAQQAGIPHATFNYWLRHYSPAEADPIDSFFRSGCGELVLGRILAAVLLVFQQRGACGIRLVSEFLQLAQAGGGAGAERRARAGGEREAVGWALLGHGGWPGADGGREKAATGDGRRAKEGGLARRRGVVEVAPGRKIAGGRSSTRKRGVVPEVEFVRGGTQRSLVVAAARA